MNPSITIEKPPSPAARLLSYATRLTVRTALRVGSQLPHLPWPFGLIELAARNVPRLRGPDSRTVKLPNATAQLIQVPGAGSSRVILYFHGGGFLVCGPNTHAGIITRLSRYADCPVLAVDYRMPPTHSLDDAIADCVDAYWWLRDSYEPHQIVFAGDSAGGYLALATALDLCCEGETPAALALMSPLLQLNPAPKKKDPNIWADAMFGPEAFDALAKVVRKANGGGMYEPLNWLTPNLPPVLIHVSQSEVLLHDAELATRRLSEVGVPVTLKVWPGQIHVFQIAAPFLPEAEKSLKQIGAYAVTSTLAAEKEAEKEWLNTLTDRTGTVG